MAYLINPARVQLLTVRGILESQQIINRFFYVYDGPIPSPDVDDSGTLLANFQTMYRTHVLPVAWDDYTVRSYDLAEITGAILTPSPPHRYVTQMDPSKIDSLLGGVADKGGIASVGLVKLPTHEAMRIFWKPATRAPKRFRSNYSRVSLGFPVGSLAASQEQWTAGVIASVGTAYNFMATAPLLGMPFGTGTGYTPHAWSPPYYVNVVPLGGDSRLATKKYASATVVPYVGTQTTRRFTPAGKYRGI